MSVYQALLIGYAFCGCVYWLWMAASAWRIRCRVPLLVDLQTPAPPHWPRLSIVIPACNEASSIGAAVESVLVQDYPDLEVILVDDRSTDETGPIIDEIAARDFRAIPLHVTELPEGWLGKVHALYRGVESVSGQWLLLMDADVHLAPGTLRRAVAYAEHRPLDHLALMPDVWRSSLLTDVALATFLRTFFVGMRIWAVEDPRSSACLGIGAFNLVRREAYDRTPGLAWLRLEVADDLGLGVMLKRCGGRSAVVNGTGLVGLHWYRSLAELGRGSEKGFASAMGCRFLPTAGFCLLLLALELSPLVALLPLGVPGLAPAGLVMLSALAASVVLLRRCTNGRILAGLLCPLGAVINAGLLFRSGLLGLRRGGIVWRGTLYPSRLLREGRRLRRR